VKALAETNQPTDSLNIYPARPRAVANTREIMRTETHSCTKMWRGGEKPAPFDKN